MQPRNKSVNIIGKGNGCGDAPSISDSYDTWGITQLLLKRPVDLVIDMNVYDDFRWGEEEQIANKEVVERCKLEGIPYIGLNDYPVDTIIEHFGVDYFTNTVDYAIAFAIYRKYEKINMYGVNMALGSEYSYQKPGVEFWCGVAIGKGIKVNVYGKYSTIMKARDGMMYGYDRPQVI
jgi:hypothetical protein